MFLGEKIEDKFIWIYHLKTIILSLIVILFVQCYVVNAESLEKMDIGDTNKFFNVLAKVKTFSDLKLFLNASKQSNLKINIPNHIFPMYVKNRRLMDKTIIDPINTSKLKDYEKYKQDFILLKELFDAGEIMVIKIIEVACKIGDVDCRFYYSPWNDKKLLFAQFIFFNQEDYDAVIDLIKSHPHADGHTSCVGSDFSGRAMVTTLLTLKSSYDPLSKSNIPYFLGSVSSTKQRAIEAAFHEALVKFCENYYNYIERKKLIDHPADGVKSIYAMATYMDKYLAKDLLEKKNIKLYSHNDT